MRTQSPAMSIKDTIQTIYQLAKEKNANALKAFLDSGICVNITDGKDSAISLLVEEGEIEAIWFLINSFGASKWKAVSAAAKADQWKLMAELSKGAAKPAAAYGAAYNANGESQLTCLLNDKDVIDDEYIVYYAAAGAASGGHWDLMNRLIDKVADKEKCKNYAVHNTARRGDEEIVNALIEDGANIHYAVSGAARGGQWDLMYRLIDKGADTEKKRNNAVYGAAWRGDEQIVYVLIKDGANINFAVQGAADGGHVTLVNVLLDQGANKDMAAYGAGMARNFILINQLVKAGADQKQIVEGAKVDGDLPEQNILWFLSFIEEPELRKSLVDAVEKKSADFNAVAILKDAAACYALMQKRLIGFDQAVEIIESKKKKIFFPQSESRQIPIISNQAETMAEMMLGCIQNENAAALKDLLKSNADSKYCLEESPIALLIQKEIVIDFLVKILLEILREAITAAEKRISYVLLGEVLFNIACAGNQKSMNDLLMQAKTIVPKPIFLLKTMAMVAYGAGKGGHADIVNDLLTENPDFLRESAIQGAAWGGHAVLVATLLEQGASQNSMLYGAARGGQRRLINEALKAGANEIYLIKGAEKTGYLTEKNVLSFISLIDDVEIRERLIEKAVIESDPKHVTRLLQQAVMYHHYLTHTNLNFDEIKTSLDQWQTLEAKASYALSKDIWEIRKLFHILIEKIKAHTFVVSNGKTLADGQILTDTAYDIVDLCESALYAVPQEMEKMNAVFEKLANIVEEAVKPTMLASVSVFFGGMQLPGRRDPSTVALYTTLNAVVAAYKMQYLSTTKSVDKKQSEKRVVINNDHQQDFYNNL